MTADDRLLRQALQEADAEAHTEATAALKRQYGTGDHRLKAEREYEVARLLLRGLARRGYIVIATGPVNEGLGWRP